MRLRIGDILYVNPQYNIWYLSQDNIPKNIFSIPFMVEYVRDDDIAIIWIDGLKWWWGQIGESEPWTDMFITEKQYIRDKKINQLLF